MTASRPTASIPRSRWNTELVSAAVEEDLEQPLLTHSEPCTLGMVTGSKKAHYECTTRKCECLCHSNPAFRKSWQSVGERERAHDLVLILRRRDLRRR